MSVQISTGSLIALGVGAGDVAAIVGLSKRIGIWWSANSGDKEFLAMLDEDPFKGIIDLQQFNKRWRKQMRLLANGRPLTFEGEDVKKALGDLDRFTALMTCIVTALDTFCTLSLSGAILKKVLLDLFRPTERGEDILASQFTTRLNSWRSVSSIRCLMTAAEQLRRALLDEGAVLNGLMPGSEAKPMEDFLIWLLSDLTDTFVTSSSDIAGVAACLSYLGNVTHGDYGHPGITATRPGSYK